MLFAVRTGLEPATPCVTGMYSNRLNYRTKKFLLSELDGKSIMVCDSVQVFSKKNEKNSQF